jgi:hypothetical protein
MLETEAGSLSARSAIGQTTFMPAAIPPAVGGSLYQERAAPPVLHHQGKTAFECRRDPPRASGDE